MPKPAGGILVEDLRKVGALKNVVALAEMNVGLHLRELVSVCGLRFGGLREVVEKVCDIGART